MAFDSDPVGSGVVASLARPGGNITGLSLLGSDLAGKQLELLRTVLPRLGRVAVLGNSAEPGDASGMREAERAASALGVQLLHLDVQSPGDIDTAFAAASKAGVDAILVLSSPAVFVHRAQLAERAAQHRLPAIYPYPELVDAGGLMTYSVDLTDLFRRAASYVDRILNGASPGDLPVEQPTQFELVINLKAARQIGLTIPTNLLVRADRVIQ